MSDTSSSPGQNDDDRPRVVPPTWEELLGDSGAREREAVHTAPVPTSRRALREQESARAQGGQRDHGLSRNAAPGSEASSTGAVDGEVQHGGVQTQVRDEPRPRRSGGEPSSSFGFPSDRPTKRKRRWLPWVLTPLIALLVVGGGGALAAFLIMPDWPTRLQEVLAGPESIDYSGAGTGEAVVVIKEGDFGDDVAKSLVAAGVTKSFDAFYDLLLAQDDEIAFLPGAYTLKQQMSAQSALDALLDPASRVQNEVVLPEGEVLSTALSLVADALQVPIEDVQAAANDYGSFGLPAEATSLEGFIFPATYQFDPGTTPHDALQTMVNRSFQSLDAAGVAPEDRWRTVVLASLVQKEAGLRDDYYKVSRVFLNRLDTGMLLQSDATVAYGTGNTHRVQTTDAEREDPNNAYNTYVHEGLPVGPISNPGDLAIDAALHPADGPWIYFVTVDLESGETVFSETEDQHQAAVDQWLGWMDEHPEYQ